MRRVIAIIFLIMMPGCLDTTPETLSGIEILLPLGSVIEGDSAVFKATGIKPSGAKYLWDFGDGKGASGDTVTHTYVDEGDYTIILTVVDNQGRVGKAEANIIILHRNVVPVASLESTYGGLGQTIKVNSIAFFDASSSVDPDVGDVLSFEWDFGDGTVGEGVAPNHFYQSIGNFTVTLVVKDDGNLSSMAQTWVLVTIRTFDVSFFEEEVTIPVLQDYTQEGATSSKENNFPYNLTQVNYRLQWSETEQSDILGLYPDNFTFEVQTNYLLNRSSSGTSENLTIVFEALSSVPADMILSSGSTAEVYSHLFDEGFTSAKGNGIWHTYITCNEAPSFVDAGTNSFLDQDNGNDWYLYLSFSYYYAIVTEV